MLSILRLFPNHLVLRTFKPLEGCRYLSKCRPQASIYLKIHEKNCQDVKRITNFGKFKKIKCNFRLEQVLMVA
jgi:hypothetical protein